MNKHRITALLLAGLLTASCISLSGCGKKKGSTNDISAVNDSDNSDSDDSGLDINWPDRGEEMKDIIDAMIMANTENPDITYNVDDNNSFWTYLYYVLVKTGTTFNLATDDDGDGKYVIDGSAVKIFARAAFSTYDGTQNLPSIPDGFDGITYDADKNQYTYWDRGITLGLTEVYAVGDKQSDGTYLTVSYMIDSSDPNNTIIVPWKVGIFDSRTSADESPVFAYRVTSVEKVDENSAAETDAPAQ